MKLTTLKEKIKSLSDEKIDIELKDMKHVKTFKFDGVKAIELAKQFIVITTKDNKFMHIDIEDPSEIIKTHNLELVD